MHRNPNDIEVVEMPMTITTSHGTMTRETLEEYNKTAKEAEEKRLADQRAEAEARPRGECPFRRGRYDTRCIADCALYADGCTLARKEAQRDTAGKKCPFGPYSSACNSSCQLYNGGCTVIAAI